MLGAQPNQSTGTHAVGGTICHNRRHDLPQAAIYAGKPFSDAEVTKEVPAPAPLTRAGCAFLDSSRRARFVAVLLFDFYFIIVNLTPPPSETWRYEENPEPKEPQREPIPRGCSERAGCGVLPQAPEGMAWWLR